MVATIADNASVIEKELAWFERILDARIKLQLGHEIDCRDIFDIQPPELSSNDSMYGNLVAHYQMNFAERIAFTLALIPHVRPQILDIFLIRNTETDRRFSQFGGKKEGENFNGFIPTGETLLFLLAGDNLEKRFDFSKIFTGEHFFARHNILTLEKAGRNEPNTSGALSLSVEIVDLVTTGTVRKPVFSGEFPAKLIQTRQQWDELFLSSYTMEQVLEIKAWIEHGKKLLEDLGLGRKIKPGYRSLFYGPPGTGKTFTASLLGQVTHCDVYKIDLSMVVSKYIGETEKNLEKIFTKAEHKDWILFFDEADALFGKRTSIRDAHDRFANQEVSYLLQRVEDYNGVVILSTNFKSNLDEAFTRRFQSVIHFPMPKQADRLKIWKNAFSEKTPLDKDIDLGDISEKYELSGGAIMNIVRYCTLMALKDSRTNIALEDILEGIRKEFQKEGRTF